MTSMRWMLTSKIHRATVTAADLDYVGSITIDRDLMEARGLSRVGGRPCSGYNERESLRDICYRRREGIWRNLY